MTQFWYKLKLTWRLALVGWDCLREFPVLCPGDSIEFNVELTVE